MSLKEHANKKEDAYSLASKKRLMQNLENKIKKVYTNALKTVELVYGNNDEDFEAARKSILDAGNDQIRNMKEELECYNVEFIPQTIEFRTVKTEGTE